MNMSMRVREAVIADAEAVARVRVDTWRTAYKGIIRQSFLDAQSYDDKLADWKQILAETGGPTSTFVVEDTDGRVVGFAFAGSERTGDPIFTGQLIAIYILATHQRYGMGRRLVGAVAARLIEQGHRSMLVWVLADNPSRRFYERLGGEPLHRDTTLAIGGDDLVEVAYGWRDLRALSARLQEESAGPMDRG